MKTLIDYKKGIKYEIVKQENGLYEFKRSEYSSICKEWIYISKDSNYTKEAIETLFGIIL